MFQRQFFNFSTNVSALALATIALPVLPELVGASSVGVFEQQAEAANIRRNRLKERNNGLYKSSVTTQTDAEDSAEAARIEITVDVTFDGADQQSVVLDIETPDTVTAVYTSDVSADSVEKIELRLRPRDGWCDLNFDFGRSVKSSVLEGNTETLEDAACGVSAAVKLREDGRLRIAVKGAGETIGGLTAEEPASLILRDAEGSVLSRGGDAETSGTFERRNTVWSRNWRLAEALPVGADEPEFATFTAYAEDGRVLDSSSVEIEPAVPKPTVVSATIRRDRLKQRANGSFRMMAATGSILNKPETTATTVEFKLSYTNSFGEQLEEMPIISDTPQRVRLKGDVSSEGINDDGVFPVTWDSPVYGAIDLNLDLLPPAAEREDGQMGAVICDGAVVEQKTRGCKPVRIAAVDQRGDGSRVKLFLSGRPEAFGGGAFSTELYGEILISGDPIEFDEDRIWVEEPPTASPSILDGQDYQLTTTSFNAGGEIIDVSTVKGTGGGKDTSTRGIAQFGKCFLRPAGSGNLQFDTSVSIEAESISDYGLLYEIVENDLLIDVDVDNTSTGTALIERSAIAPVWRESSAVWTNLTAIEPDNVVDMEYLVVFDVVSPEGDVVEQVRAFVAASETPDAPLTITIAGENRIGVALILNEDGETFTLRVKGARSDGEAVRFSSSPGYAFLLSRIEPDDGGSEFDFELSAPDEAAIQAFFSIEGSAGLGDLSSSSGGDLDVKANASGDGEMAELLINLTVKDVKELSKPFGFGKGTKKSTTTTSARPELQ